MFKKDTLNLGDTDTLIGEESIIEGHIRSRASLRIEGKVQGDIHCDGDVTVGKNGEINSNVRARKVITAGVIRGSIDSDSLFIHASGAVHGNIQVESLSIAEGGTFDGTSKMEQGKSNQSNNQKQPSNLHKLEKKKKDDKKAASEASAKEEKAAGQQ